ncbi:septum site-determining protein MinC [Cardiobacterium hominis]|uniref:septum site-determining protein MinC n=1 Tax=Cardiobacterium hominis TaxID=2718 RepID=UPI0028EC43B9|nr:septum site-determining protein MinC [Cardiobacterium hominis]
MSDPLPFKGRSVSVTAVLLQDTDTAQIDESLSAKIAQVPPDFFATQPLVADLSALQDFKPDSKWLKTLKRIFERHQLPLVGVCGAPVERSALIAAGLAEVTISADNKTKTVAAEKSEAAPPPPPPAAPAIKAAPTKLIRHNIRSGQRIMAKGGDLVVIGTVSPGAEIYADGNITVYGALRGRAFAGGQDETAAYIYCYELDAELISIAGFYQDKEQLQANPVRKNVLISLNPDESMQIVSV